MSNQDRQEFYGSELERLTKEAGLEMERASEIKKGQTFIWAAGLIHGGSRQNDDSQNRLSQVTHYYFEGALIQEYIRRLGLFFFLMLQFAVSRTRSKVLLGPSDELSQRTRYLLQGHRVMSRFRSKG